MRVSFIGYLTLLSSPFTIPAILPANLALAPQSSPVATVPRPPFCVHSHPICVRPLEADCNAMLQVDFRANPDYARRLRQFVPRPPTSEFEYQVPATFVGGTCRITISLVAGHSLEWSSLAEVAEIAQPLIWGCLGASTPQYAGGYNVAGLADALGILVHGPFSGVSQGVTANRTGAQLTGRTVNEPAWCQTVNEGRVLQSRSLRQALFSSGSVPSLEQPDLAE